MKNPFYITTTLPYVNSDPHIGFAMEVIRADIIARWKKSRGYEVFFNTGTDEHGQKIWKKAIEAGIDVQKYVDEFALKFKGLKELLNLSDDLNFIRTTDENHTKTAQKFWELCDKNGYIYKKNYKIKYCVGCELEKTDSELDGDKCPLHPNQKIEIIDEENYFFKFSSFQKPLLDFYKKNPDFVIPDFKFNEIRSFVERGLEDFSISRLKSKMPWGIEVPGDSQQVMYVWFDALVNYISAIGWGKDEEKFKKWAIETGGMVQYCGKDNLRQQAAMWQAMLMAAGLPNSKQIVINGFITAEGGTKMSKSLGNTVDPYDIVKEYNGEALRYFLSREVHPFEDSPFTKERFKDAYNGSLANGLGNLVSRVIKMAENGGISTKEVLNIKVSDEVTKIIDSYFEKYEINKVCDYVWKMISESDLYIQTNQPFKTIKTDQDKGKEQITFLLNQLSLISNLLEPIMPETSLKIKEVLKVGKLGEPLFLRKD